MNPDGPRPNFGPDIEPGTLWQGAILHTYGDNERPDEFIKGEIPVTDYAERARDGR